MATKISPQAENYIKIVREHLEQRGYDEPGAPGQPTQHKLYDKITLRNRSNAMRRFIVRWEAMFNKPFAAVTQVQVRQVIEQAYKEGAPRETLKDELTAMRLFFRVFIERGDIKNALNPAEGITAPGYSKKGQHKKRSAALEHDVFVSLDDDLNEFVEVNRKGRSRAATVRALLLENRANKLTLTARDLQERYKEDLASALEDLREKIRDDHREDLLELRDQVVSAIAFLVLCLFHMTVLLFEHANQTPIERRNQPLDPNDIFRRAKVDMPLHGSGFAEDIFKAIIKSMGDDDADKVAA